MTGTVTPARRGQFAAEGARQEGLSCPQEIGYDAFDVANLLEIPVRLSVLILFETFTAQTESRELRAL